MPCANPGTTNPVPGISPAPIMELAEKALAAPPVAAVRTGKGTRCQDGDAVERANERQARAVI